METYTYRSEQEMFQYIIDKLETTEEKQVQKQALHDAGLLDNADVLQRLKISARTAIRWRKRGILKYTKIGGKIYYRLEDIEALMRQLPEQKRGKRKVTS